MDYSQCYMLPMQQSLPLRGKNCRPTVGEYRLLDAGVVYVQRCIWQTIFEVYLGVIGVRLSPHSWRNDTNNCQPLAVAYPYTGW